MNYWFQLLKSRKSKVIPLTIPATSVPQLTAMPSRIHQHTHFSKAFSSLGARRPLLSSQCPGIELSFMRFLFTESVSSLNCQTFSIQQVSIPDFFSYTFRIFSPTSLVFMYPKETNYYRIMYSKSDIVEVPHGRVLNADADGEWREGKGSEGRMEWVLEGVSHVWQEGTNGSLLKPKLGLHFAPYFSQHGRCQHSPNCYLLWWIVLIAGHTTYITIKADLQLYVKQINWYSVYKVLLEFVTSLKLMCTAMGNFVRNCSQSHQMSQ